MQGRVIILANSSDIINCAQGHSRQGINDNGDGIGSAVAIRFIISNFHLINTSVISGDIRQIEGAAGFGNRLIVFGPAVGYAVGSGCCDGDAAACAEFQTVVGSGGRFIVHGEGKGSTRQSVHCNGVGSAGRTAIAISTRYGVGSVSNKRMGYRRFSAHIFTPNIAVGIVGGECNLSVVADAAFTRDGYVRQRVNSEGDGSLFGAVASALGSHYLVDGGNVDVAERACR